jgi:hypothetical protein
MNRRTQNPKSDPGRTSASYDIALRKLIWLCVAVAMFVVFVPGLINAQDTGDGNSTSPELSLSDQSGYEPEEAVQPSGQEGEAFPEFPMTGGEAFDQSPSETEPEVEEEEEEFRLPEIEVPDFAELYDLSPAQTERPIFANRPYDEYYYEVVSRAPAPDITMLGPLPTVSEEGVEFTDVAADWIWNQKSIAVTELRGHVMVIYDTTIISCDEATLDEGNEIYKFFGEGRVFVDDADFTLECDELEIHDAEEEKTIYIRGQSTMVMYADEDAVEPAEDAGRREKIEYALKQQDTTITFTDAEYDYENDIFDAHGGVRFEQSDKYAEGGEFHGENETQYMHFIGDCEFWQEDGEWLYQYRILEDREEPPSQGDRLTRALMAVPTTITCDEAEMKGDDGWIQMLGLGGNVVYFHQDDKHAECEAFTMWYTEEEEEEEAEEAPEEAQEGPRDLISEPEEQPAQEDEEEVYNIPPGFGAMFLAQDFPPDWLPWEHPRVSPVPETTQPVETPPPVSTQPREQVEPPSQLEMLMDIARVYLPDDVDFENSTVSEIINQLPPEVREDLPDIPDDVLNTPVHELLGEEEVGRIAELTELQEQIVTGEPSGESEEPQNEILMQGNVFIRQENGDWLFDYDVVREEDESEETVEQYRKWANASCDNLRVWTEEGNVEATGSVFGEQDNQDLACDFLRFINRLDMLYMRGNLVVHREGKHQLMSNEGFVFLSTNVFEALGSVQTTVMVDVEEQRRQAEEGEGEEGMEEETTPVQ